MQGDCSCTSGPQSTTRVHVPGGQGCSRTPVVWGDVAAVRCSVARKRRSPQGNGALTHLHRCWGGRWCCQRRRAPRGGSCAPCGGTTSWKSRSRSRCAPPPHRRGSQHSAQRLARAPPQACAAGHSNPRSSSARWMEDTAICNLALAKRIKLNDESQCNNCSRLRVNI